MAKRPKQPKLVKGANRTIGQKAQGLKQRIGGVGAGQHPKSKAPRTLPKMAQKGPRVKPKGPTRDKAGRRQINPNLLSK